jgi:acetyltransferase-like isoleucine patch superfamily enzyme
MKNSYGLGELIKNLTSLVYTKIFYKGARLIRTPIYVRGKKFLSYGKGFTTGYNCRIEMFDVSPSEGSKVQIGNNCKIGDHVHIAAGEKVIIGENCLFASKIYISDISHGDYSDLETASNPTTPPDERPLVTKPVTIGNNVWLGDNVCVLPGVSIGNGCVIGANAVVNRDIPENCLAAGVPAKVIKKYDIDTNTWRSINN